MTKTRRTELLMVLRETWISRFMGPRFNMVDAIETKKVRPKTRVHFRGLARCLQGNTSLHALILCAFRILSRIDRRGVIHLNEFTFQVLLTGLTDADDGIFGSR